MKSIKIQIICALIFGLIAFNFSSVQASSGAEDKPSAEEMLVDVFLVRPLGLVTTLLGTGFFCISLPFSVLGGNTVDVFGELVAGPATFTFQRPVGELDY
ncbi:conserved hypothetical protein, membrane [Candidatus Magnetomorum sp. HK-1]|nr:conserved hypothetical protein, membrane [Candidatus Magnetomorum sp. HK-1]